MSRLLACPFCRELFADTEADNCPDCEIPLKPLHQLPPSLEAVEEQAASWESNGPDDMPRPWHDLGLGKGALLAIAVASLVLFGFAPWLEVRSPYAQLHTGLDLARGRLGWLWGGAIGWFVTIALVVSRRTAYQMRGVRIIIGLFAAMTAAEVALLVALSPERSGAVSFAYAWGWGAYAALVLGIAGMVAAARFGGPPHPAAAQEHPTTASVDTSTVH